MAGAQVTNRAWGEIGSSITATTTEIVLKGSQGDRFPAAEGSSTYFYATLFDETGAREIVRCNYRTPTTLTVTRGEDGTVARSWPAGTTIRVHLVAALINNKVSKEDFNSAVKTLEDADKQMRVDHAMLKEKFEEFKNKTESNNLDGAATAKDTLTVEKTFTAKGDLVAEGKATVKGELTADKNATLKSDLNVAGALTVGKTAKVTGDLTCSGTVYGQVIQSMSDISMKENLVLMPTDVALKLIDAIKIYTFNWKSDPTDKSIGCVAQELEKIIPDAVKPKKDRLTVNYMAVTSVLLAAVQQLHKEIEEMKKCQKQS